MLEPLQAPKQVRFRKVRPAVAREGKSLEAPSVGRRVAVSNLSDYSWIRNWCTQKKGREASASSLSFCWHNAVVGEKGLVLKIQHHREKNEMQ